MAVPSQPASEPALPKGGAYPKEARLRRARDFEPARRRGRRFAGAQCSIRVVSTDLGRARLGIATPRAYGDSVRRNRFRRLVREAFRRVAPELGSSDWLVEPRKGLVEPTLQGVVADLRAARP